MVTDVKLSHLQRKQFIQLPHGNFAETFSVGVVMK